MRVAARRRGPRKSRKRRALGSSQRGAPVVSQPCRSRSSRVRVSPRRGNRNKSSDARRRTARIAGRAGTSVVLVSLTLAEARARAAQLSAIDVRHRAGPRRPARRHHVRLPDDGPLRRAGRPRRSSSSPAPPTSGSPSTAPPPTPAYDGKRITLSGLADAQRGRGRGPGALRHRRRRDAHVHRPGRRRALRLGLPRHGRRPAGLPLLRPARPQGADRADRDRRPAPGPWSANGRVDRQRAPATWAFAHDPADLDVPLRRLRRPVALRDVGARADGRRCRSAGTPGGRWPPSWTATPTSCRRITDARASTTTPSCSTSPSRSTPTTRSFVPGPQLGRAWRRPGCVTFRDEFLPRGADHRPGPAAPRAPSSPTRWRTCGSATW